MRAYTWEELTDEEKLAGEWAYELVVGYGYRLQMAANSACRAERYGRGTNPSEEKVLGYLLDCFR